MRRQERDRLAEQRAVGLIQRIQPAIAADRQHKAVAPEPARQPHDQLARRRRRRRQHTGRERAGAPDGDAAAKSAGGASGHHDAHQSAGARGIALRRRCRCRDRKRCAPEDPIQLRVDRVHDVGAAAEKEHLLEAAVGDQVAEDERRRQRLRSAIAIVQLARIEQLHGADGVSRHHQLGLRPAFALRSPADARPVVGRGQRRDRHEPGTRRHARTEHHRVAARREFSRIDTRDTLDGGRVVERAVLAAVLDNRRALGRRQPEHERDVCGTREIHVDAPMLARQILDDGHQIVVGALRSASDHLIDRLQPLVARAARRRPALGLVARAAVTLEVGFRRRGCRLLPGESHRRCRGEQQRPECSG